MEQFDPTSIIPSSAKLHHTALARGYVARTGRGYVLVYKGRFGRGYVYHAPSYQSTGLSPS